MPGLPFFLALETRVWYALAAGDARADRACLSAGFLGVYPTGFAGRDDHAGQLADGPTVARYRIEDARLLPLGAGRALLAYRAVYTRPGHSGSEAMYVSSIWAEEDGRWLNIFSQDSVETDTAPV